MNDLIQTQLEVGFGAGAGGPSPPISIEQVGLDPTISSVLLLLISPVSCQLAVSAGSITRGGLVAFPVPPGVITFGGGNTSSLPRVPQGSPVFKTLFAFTPTGNLTTMSCHYDHDTYQVVANKACHAAVSYSAYTAKAQELSYTPLVSGGVTLYGVVAAFAPPSSMTTYQVQPTNEHMVSLEIYRIVSDVITNGDGQFELPNDYPTGGNYTNPANPMVIDVSNSLKTERAHEIGTLGLGGAVGVRKYFVPIYAPFTGTAYKPKLRCVNSTLPKELSAREVAAAKDAIAKAGYGCK
jgi:hypothetical protein